MLKKLCVCVCIIFQCGMVRYSPLNTSCREKTIIGGAHCSCFTTNLKKHMDRTKHTKKAKTKQEQDILLKLYSMFNVQHIIENA